MMPHPFFGTRGAAVIARMRRSADFLGIKARAQTRQQETPKTQHNKKPPNENPRNLADLMVGFYHLALLRV